MVEFYAKLVRAGMLIDKVPEKWREAVKQELERTH